VLGGRAKDVSWGTRGGRGKKDIRPDGEKEFLEKERVTCNNEQEERVGRSRRVRVQIRGNDLYGRVTEGTEEYRKNKSPSLKELGSSRKAHRG